MPLLLLVLLLVGTGLSAQAYRARVMLEGKWGVVDDHGRKLLKPIWPYVSEFIGPWAVVEGEEYLGWTDTSGRVHLPDSLDAVEYLYEPRASQPSALGLRVARGGKWGVLHPQTGRVLVPLQFDYVDHLGHGRIWANRGGRMIQRANEHGVEEEAFEGGLWQLWDLRRADSVTGLSFRHVQPCMTEACQAVSGLKSLLLSAQTGKVLHDTTQTVLGPELEPRHPDGPRWFALQAAADTALSHTTSRRGWISADGKIRVQPLAQQVLAFEGPTGLMAVWDGQDWSYCTPDGRPVGPRHLLEALPMQQGKAFARSARGWGSLDADGRLLQDFDPRLVLLRQPNGQPVLLATQATELLDEVAPHVMVAAGPSQPERKLGLLNADGSWRLAPDYDFLSRFGDGGVLVARQAGRWGLLNLKGETVLPFEYDDISTTDAGGAALKNGQWHLLGPNGRLRFGPDSAFTEVSQLNARLLVAGRKTGLALLSIEGKALTAYRHPHIAVHNHLVKVYLDGPDAPNARFLLYDSVGQRLSDKPYTAIEPYEQGYAAARHSQGWTLLDAQAREVFPLGQEPPQPVGQHLFRRRQADGLFRVLDVQGRPVGRYSFEDVGFFAGNVLPVKMYGKWGLLRPNGELLVSPEWDLLEPYQAVGP